MPSYLPGPLAPYKLDNCHVRALVTCRSYVHGKTSITKIQGAAQFRSCISWISISLAIHHHHHQHHSHHHGEHGGAAAGGDREDDDNDNDDDDDDDMLMVMMVTSISSSSSSSSHILHPHSKG